jgi:hypothetical protein
MAAEYNTNNKQLGRNMMHHAESCQVLPEEHGGSRKDWQAAEQVLNKRLAMDITRQTRRAMGMAGTDAKILLRPDGSYPDKFEHATFGCS